VRNRLTQVATGSSAQLLSNYNGRGERVLASQGAPAPSLPATSAAWTTSGVRGYVYDEAGQVISTLIAGDRCVMRRLCGWTTPRSVAWRAARVPSTRST